MYQRANLATAVWIANLYLLSISGGKKTRRNHDWSEFCKQGSRGNNIIWYFFDIHETVRNYEIEKPELYMGVVKRSNWKSQTRRWNNSWVWDQNFSWKMYGRPFFVFIWFPNCICDSRRWIISENSRNILNRDMILVEVHNFQLAFRRIFWTSFFSKTEFF